MPDQEKESAASSLTLQPVIYVNPVRQQQIGEGPQTATQTLLFPPLCLPRKDRKVSSGRPQEVATNGPGGLTLLDKTVLSEDVQMRTVSLIKITVRGKQLLSWQQTDVGVERRLKVTSTIIEPPEGTRAS